MQGSDPLNRSRSNHETGTDLEYALLESLFYNEMVMLGEGFDFSSFEQEFLEGSDKLEPYTSPSNHATSRVFSQSVGTSTQVESDKWKENNVPSRPKSRKEKAATKNMPIIPTSFASASTGPSSDLSTSQKLPAVSSLDNAAAACVSNSHQSASNVSKTVGLTSTSESDNLESSSALSHGQDHQVSKVVAQFSLLASRLGIKLPNSIMESLTAAAIQRNHPPTTSSLEHITPLDDTTENSESSDVEDEDLVDEERLSTKIPSKQVLSDHLDNKRKRLATDSTSIMTTPGSKEVMDAAKKAQKSSVARRRKVPRLDDCEKRLVQLRAENEMLKRHHVHVTNKTNKLDQERKDMDSKIHYIVKCSLETGSLSTSMDQELNSILPKFKDMYSDYGIHRKEELAFHLNQLEKLAVPANFTKMSLWTLGQNESFYTKPKLNPIAGILKKELEITPAQGRKIISQREKIQTLCTNIKQCLALIAKLKTLCEHKQRIFHDRMSKVQEILSPLQVAKLLAWIDGHNDVLDGVCPGWGSEQLRK